MWGANARLRNLVLVVVAVLILGRAVTSIWLVEDNWRSVARWLGIPVVPDPDPARANAKLRPGDLQGALGSPDNYPEAARDRGEQGAATAGLLIGTSGLVESCTITKSSGSISLDAATCQRAREHARFDPARDAAGRPIASIFVLRVRWVLPEE